MLGNGYSHEILLPTNLEIPIERDAAKWQLPRRGFVKNVRLRLSSPLFVLAVESSAE